MKQFKITVKTNFRGTEKLVTFKATSSSVNQALRQFISKTPKTTVVRFVSAQMV